MKLGSNGTALKPVTYCAIAPAAAIAMPYCGLHHQKTLTTTAVFTHVIDTSTAVIEYYSIRISVNRVASSNNKYSVDVNKLPEGKVRSYSPVTTVTGRKL
eukprot:9813-Heterococcus_DN1.PRE.2